MSVKMNKSNYYVSARRETILKLKAVIEAKGPEGFPQKQLFGYLKMLGYREKTAISYVDALESGGHIRYDVDKKAYVSNSPAKAE